MNWTEFDFHCMQRALQLAARGEGWVEPNPQVGCVLAREGRILGEGWHRKLGGPHAEIEALSTLADGEARGATAYVTLEPCSHHGKTPPCTEALIAAGVARVVAAQRDPFPEVAGRGFAQLQAAGIAVESGCCEEEARWLNGPYLTLIERGRPWVITKWAMSLDGRIATRTGHSQWISSPASREQVHRLRGRVDAILVGIGTVLADDPLLTARSPGARTATRVIVDSQCRLPLESRLVRSAQEIPVLVATTHRAAESSIHSLLAAGCEVWQRNRANEDGEEDRVQIGDLLAELGRRRMTNLLVEGGSGILGAFFDGGWINEVHIFIAPKLIGGEQAFSPLAGVGRSHVPDASMLAGASWQMLDDDLWLRGRLRHPPENISSDEQRSR